MQKIKPENPKPTHKPVLIKEVVEGLQLQGKKVVVDCTLGLGGHAREMLELMPKNGKLIGFDLDNEHIKLAKKVLKDFQDRVIYVNANFNTLADNLHKLGIKSADAFLFDLGLASPHVDMGERGFSFMKEGPLDMRFNIKQELTAEEVINKYSEKELLRIFREYGEEKKARRLAFEICQSRRRKPFKTTTQLADFVEKIVKRQGHIHPATRIFQALRIEVNHELDALRQALLQTLDFLKPGGRFAVISYHSLEDRIVKNFIRDNCRDYVNLPDEKETTHLIPKLKMINKKPVEPTAEEMKVNPRSRSAKLRVAERLAETQGAQTGAHTEKADPVAVVKVESALVKQVETAVAKKAAKPAVKAAVKKVLKKAVPKKVDKFKKVGQKQPKPAAPKKVAKKAPQKAAKKMVRKPVKKTQPKQKVKVPAKKVGRMAKIFTKAVKKFAGALKKKKK